VVVAVGVTLCEPVVAFDVVQGALQEVASRAVHVNVAAWPAVIEAGAALSVMLGFGGTVTVTTALAVAVPPAPVQLIV
jgi:hypothetical protein